MEELKRKVGRPRKPRESILSPEVIEGLLTPAQLAERETRGKERLRGIARRKEANAEKEIENITTKEELWAMNRKLLSEAELSALLEKQERVWDQLHWVSDVLAGTNLPPDDIDYVSVEEGAADLFKFVKVNGTVTVELILLGPYWQTPLYKERFHGSDPTSIFARYGLVVGIPELKLYEFQKFLVTQTTTATPLSSSGNGYTTLRCSVPGCTSWPEAVKEEIAAGYKEKGIPYRCPKCIELERKSKGESTLFQRGVPSRRGPQ